MNLDFYRNYISIVECGTLSAAAIKLHVAQSALSMQVKQFEAEYGTKLFIRGARQMEPTEAGKIVYRRAKAILSLDEAAHKEVEACIVGLQGTVRLGMTQAYPDPGMAELLTGFQRENPQLHFEIFESGSSEVIDLLRTGVAELGVIRSTGLLPPDLTEHFSVRQQQCVCWNIDAPWFDRHAEQVSLDELEGVPLALSRGFERSLRDLFQRSGVNPQIHSVSTSRSTAAMWAESGAMAAIVCLENAESFETSVRLCRPLYSDDTILSQSLSAVRSLVSVKGQFMPATAKHFIQYATAHTRHILD